MSGPHRVPLVQMSTRFFHCSQTTVVGKEVGQALLTVVERNICSVLQRAIALVEMALTAELELEESRLAVPCCRFSLPAWLDHVRSCWANVPTDHLYHQLYAAASALSRDDPFRYADIRKYPFLQGALNQVCDRVSLFGFCNFRSMLDAARSL